MARINIQSFSPSDPQSDLVSKLNQNFNQISNALGGTLADLGPTGERGLIGQRGPAGATGQSGRRGTRWFVQSNGPTGSNVNIGDYWFDSNADCYIYTSSGWSFVSTLKRDLDLFQTIDNAVGPAGITSGTVIAINQEIPEDFGFVVANDQPEQAGNLNPQGAKFVISSNSTSYPLEFTKDTTGSTGSTGDSVQHPFFNWLNGSDIQLTAPDGLTVDYGGGATGSMDINTVNDITFESQSGSLTLVNQQITSSGNIIVNAASGKLQITGSYISIGPSQSDFGIDGNYDFNFNFYPTYGSNTGYFNVSKNINEGGISVFPYTQPVLRITRFFNYGAELYSSSSDVNLAKFSSTGTDAALEIRSNGKIYTKKTSEKYYKNTSNPVFTWTTP